MPIVTIPGVGNVTFPDSMSQDQILSAIENDILKKPATSEVKGGKEAPERTIGNIAGDIGVTALKGAVGLPQAAAGLADIPFGLVGLGSPVTKGLEKVGVRFGETQKALDEMYSPAQKAAFERVQKAQGFIPTAVEAIKNPSVPLAIAGQSIPQMLGGAGIARQVIARGASPIIGAAAGEGAIGAGAAAAEMREASPDEQLSAKQALAALGAGVTTGALGVAGGKAAKALGLDDIDTLIAKGGTGATEAAAAKSGYLKAIAGSGLTEGFLEEMPQSAQEQMWKNWAGDRPLLEGVPEAASLGAVVGAGFGGVGGAAGRYMRDQAPEQSEFDRRRAEMEGKAPAITPFDEASPLENPYGNIPAADIGDVAAQINGARAKRKQSPLQSFSVEDIVESGLPPEQTDQLLSAALTKSGFDPAQAVEPQDIMDAAAERGLDPERPGFRDFLRRASGAENPEQMTPVQRVAAFGAIQSLPEGVDSLPTGTNAQRFTETQYKAGLKAIKGAISGGASRDNVIAAIQKTGVKDIRDAQSILQNAIKGGELGAVSTPTFTVMDDFGNPVRSYDSKEQAEQLAGRLNGQVQESSVTKFVSPELAGGDVRPGSYRDEPSGFEIRVGDTVLRKTDTAEDAEVAAERLQQIRGRLASTFNNQVEGINQKIATSNQPLEVMEAQGQTETPQYAKLKKQTDKTVQELTKKRDALVQQAAEFSRPLHVGVAAPKAVGKKGFTRFEGGRPVEYLSSLGALPKPTTGPATDRDVANIDALRKKLLPALKRFGLEGVGLRVVKSIEDGGAGADGAYADKLIQVALSAENPMGVMRHEVIHALKELGAFTAKEWRVLEGKAKSEWVNKFIREAGTYERYQQVYENATGSLEGFDEYIAEEAIAEAFKYFDATKVPPGLVGNLFGRIRNFFASLRNALQGAGFQTADEVLGRIEEGKVTPTQAEAPAAAPKFSVARQTDEQFFEGERRKPKARQVVFEIAPNPDDKDLSALWNSMSQNQKIEISNKVKDKFTKPVMDTIGARGRVTGQVGSYLDDTNASYAMYLEKGNPIDAANALGFVFKQQSMMVVSPNPAKGLQDFGSIVVDVGDKSFDEIQDIYNTLRGININGNQPVSGQTTSNGKMIILNNPEWSGMETDELAEYVDAAFDYTYNVLTKDVFASFPEAKDYDYASPENDPAGSRGDIRRRLRGIRDEASKALGEEIAAARKQAAARGDTTPLEGKRVTTDTIVVDGQARPTKTSTGTLIYPTEEGVKNFWRWFGNSVFVDENGRPLVMYHGTAREVDEFVPKQANAIFITPQVEFAGRYKDGVLTGVSMWSESWMVEHYEEILSPEQIESAKLEALENIDQQTKKDYKLSKNAHHSAFVETSEFMQALMDRMPSRANIIPLFVKAENPFNYDNEAHIRQVVDRLFQNAGIDLEEEPNETIRLKNESGSIADKQYSENEIYKMLSKGFWPLIEQEEVQWAIRDLEFDGFSVQEMLVKNYAVLDPNQVKSAVGNDGRFSEKKSIRFSIEKDIKNRFGQAGLDSIKKNTATRNEETFVDRMIGAISPESRERLRKQMINKYEPIERNSKILADRFGESRLFADQSAISAALFSDRASGVAAEAFKKGIPVYDKGYTKVDDMGGKVKGLIDTLSPLMKYNDPFVFQAFQFYGATRRGARLYQEGREKLLTPQDIQFGRQLEQAYPEFKQVFEDYQKYNRGIVKFLVDTGVLTEEMGRKWSMYADYIPFYRQAAGEQTFGPKLFNNLSGVQPSKKLKGGEFKLDDFLETVVRNTRSAIEQGMKNVAAQRAVRDAMSLNAPNQFDYAKRLPSGAVGGQDVVNVREKGVDVKYQVADPLWVEAMKGFYAPNPYETILKIVGFPTSLLRNIVTKMPDFIVANLLRDSMSAWVTSGMKFKPIIDTFKQAGIAVAGKSPEVAVLRAAGIGSGYDFAGDINASAKALAKELRKKTGKRTAGEIAMLPLSSIWDALDAGSNASDMATRAEIFKRTLAETGNEAEAIFRAMEVMNFSRMGSSPLVQIMSAITPFFNARVQGLDLIYRAGMGRLAQANRKTAHKAFMIRATTMFALSMLYWMLASDSDEYKKADEETRDNNWIIGSVKIPIPFEIGVMFKVVPERMMGYLFGTDTGKDVKDAAVRNILSTLSMNPVPQAILPILEANVTDSGYSVFTGRSIVPRGLDDVAKPLQETSMTSIAAKKLGKELGVSPIKIDHVIRGYFGAMGTYTSMALDAMLRTTSDPIKPAMTLEQTPVLRRFFASDKAQGTVNAFYDLKDRVDELARTTNYLQLAGRFDDFDAYIKENGRLLELKPMLSHIEKDLKRIREMEKVVNSAREEDMTAEEKRLVLDQVRESKNYLTDQMRVLRKEVSRQP